VDIREEINRAIAECAERSMRKPTALYLGRNQITEVYRVARESSPCTYAQPERPKYAGLLVYEVNSDNHCVAA